MTPYQLPPPRDWDVFQDLCADLFALEWGDPGTERYGRNGQEQHGIDVYGRPGGTAHAAVQCKGKRNWPPKALSVREVDNDVEKARLFVPALEEFVVATTAPTDARLQDHARTITARHQKLGLFRVRVIGWDELVRRVTSYPALIEKYYPAFGHLSAAGHAEPITDALATARLGGYTGEFLVEYTERSNGLIDFLLSDGPEQLWSSQVTSRLASLHEAVVVGPPGCGKSMLARRTATEWTSRAGIAIFLESKHFEGDFPAIVNQEVALLTDCSVEELISYAQRLGRPVLVVLDGYNECPEPRQRGLLRAARRWTSRVSGALLITGHRMPADPSELHELEVHPPTLELKRAIADVDGDAESGSALDALLAAVTSGLEARLVRSLEPGVKQGSSRFALFESYLRSRFGTGALDVIRCLSMLAGQFRERLTWSLSNREIEAQLVTNSINPATLDVLLNSNLLVSRGSRLSFSHELFLEAMTAEWALRMSGGDGERLLELLGQPAFRDSGACIIGAIEDWQQLEIVVAGIEDPQLLDECLSGTCGAEARELAERDSREVLSRMTQEVGALSFVPSGEAWGVSADATGFEWSAHDVCVIELLATRLDAGHYLDEVLAAFRLASQRVLDEEKSLLDSWRGRGNLRDALFASVFVFGSRPGLSQLSATTHGVLHRNSDASDLVARLEDTALSNGEAYLLLQLCRLSDHSDNLARCLPDLFERLWPAAPYHLRLDLLTAAEGCWRADDALRSKLVRCLESLPQQTDLGLSGSLIDALARLGALEPVELEEELIVRAQFDSALKSPANSELRLLMLRSFRSQFDHPLSAAYARTWGRLSDSDRSILLRMALEGATASKESFGVDVLIHQLQTAAAPGCQELLHYWCRVPEYDHFDEFDVFAAAYIALGRLGCELPASGTSDVDGAVLALGACGELLYWLNRNDLAPDVRRKCCVQPWACLNQHELGVAADALARCEPRWWFPTDATDVRSIKAAFPDEVAEVCRNALLRLDSQRSHYREAEDVAEPRRMRFILSVLGAYGTRRDLVLLRDFADDARGGSAAISAIRAIEARS